MIDWTSEKQITYEYCLVDHATWRDGRKLEFVRGCTITEDIADDLRFSAQIDMDEALTDEVYIRAYMVVSQGRERERVCLATVLAQTPEIAMNGKTVSCSLDCYSPLLELRDDCPPIGYTTPAGTSALAQAEKLASAHCRAPVVPSDDNTALNFNMSALDDDTWLSYIDALAAEAGAHLTCNARGELRFEPIVRTSALAPVRTYRDDDLSILYPDVTEKSDWYGLPNAVEVVLSSGARTVTATVEDEGSGALSSLDKRGRRVLCREMSPDVPDSSTREELLAYAANLLAEKAALEKTVEMSHGFDKSHAGECIRLIYDAHEYSALAQVESQHIDCTTEARVNATLRLIG